MNKEIILSALKNCYRVDLQDLALNLDIKNVNRMKINTLKEAIIQKNGLNDLHLILYNSNKKILSSINKHFGLPYTRRTNDILISQIEEYIASRYGIKVIKEYERQGIDQNEKVIPEDIKPFASNKELSMKKKYQIFVSSTYTDLKEERQAAVEAILEAHHIPAGMELFSAGNISQLDTIKKWIDESDIYMLILGRRYGSIEPNSGLSYTEIEYNYAVDKKMPLFAIVMKEKIIKSNISESSQEEANKKKYDKFKNVVTSKVCHFFEDIKDIKISIHQSIRDIESNNKLTGWISCNENIINDEEKAKVNKLEEEIEKLKIEIQGYKIQNKNKFKVHEKFSYNELKENLQKIMINNSSLFDYFIKYHKEFIAGVYHYDSYGIFENFEYLEIAPKLFLYDLVLKRQLKGKKEEGYYLSENGKNFLLIYNQEK